MGDWVWDGARTSVDFVNTLRDRVVGARETLHAPADLADWFVAAALTGDRLEVTEAELAIAVRLRDAIDAAAGAALAGRPVAAGDVETLNAVAASVSLAPRLAVDAAGRPYASTDTSAAAALARIAIDAIDLLTGGELARLRICAADDCGVRFVDRSPGGNRQWCSMRRCGNRRKARRHYARRRGTGMMRGALAASSQGDAQCDA
ncbi:MAG TPA: ABATE domain-containing protein [Streptosporangiaceae bacterium]